MKKDPDQMKNRQVIPPMPIPSECGPLMNYFATTRIPGWWKTENSLKLPR